MRPSANDPSGPPRPGGGDDGEAPAPTGDNGPGWKKLTWPERIPILFAVLVMAAVTVPRLPPGVCYSDPGDLQLASATLGIPHPPGYPIYVSLGYLITRIPGVDPAYMVSLACLAAGIGAICLAMLAQVRLGGSAWVAAVTGVALTAQARVWQNLLAPEVYAPTLLFLAGSAYLLLKHGRLGWRPGHSVRWRRAEWGVAAAALLFGVALADRPPVAFALPFFVLAWWLIRRRWDTSWRQSLAAAAVAAAGLVVPVVYSLAYLYVRDVPGTPYNYIEQYRAEDPMVPPIDAGPQAKMERAIWQASGAQFRRLMGTNWAGVRSKLRWLRGELEFDATPVLVAAPALVLLGIVLAGRRDRASSALLAGMIAQPVVFVCAYRIYGQAADLLPLLWAGAVAAGVAVSVPFVLLPPRVQRTAGAGLLVLVSVWTAVDAGKRWDEARSQDASPFVQGVDLATIPQDSVICTDWMKMAPLLYAKQVLAGRQDVRVICAWPGKWLGMIEPLGDRPVYFVSTIQPLPEGFELRASRKMWRLVRRDGDTE